MCLLNPWQFFLGFVEGEQQVTPLLTHCLTSRHYTAGFFPGVIFLLSCFYKVGITEPSKLREILQLINQAPKPFELAKRMAIFCECSMSVTSGLSKLTGPGRDGTDSASLMSGAFGGLLAGVITEYSMSAEVTCPSSVLSN
jgi:hypothetical protein